MPILVEGDDVSRETTADVRHGPVTAGTGVNRANFASWP